MHLGCGNGSVQTGSGCLTLLPASAAAAYYLPRHLAPNPTYPHLYPPYLIRGYPDTAALENRQTIINDYITSQQMHHNAATAMAQRADMLRGLSPRESSLALNYATGPRGGRGRRRQAVGGSSRGCPPVRRPSPALQASLGAGGVPLSGLLRHRLVCCPPQASSTCPKCHTCLCWCLRHLALPPPPWTASPTSLPPHSPSAAAAAAPRCPQVGCLPPEPSHPPQPCPSPSLCFTIPQEVPHT